MTGALSGIRIIDWGSFHHGIGGSYMLGDLGAEVIHIEDRIKGDMSRGVHSLYGSSTLLPAGRNVLFETTNRNKKSITLDITKEEGRNIVHEMVKKSDVFLTNFRQDAAKKHKLDYETLKKHNPKLIYARASGYGKFGPESELRAFDVVAQARSGMMEQTGEAVGPPSTVTGAVLDQMGATMLAYGIMAALLARERQGIGQELETSLLGSAIHLQAMSVNQACLTGRAFSRHNRKRARNPLANYYQCADEKWIMFSELQSDRFWTDFCNAVGLPEMITDPRFESSKARRESFVECIEILDKHFMTKPRDEWMKLIREKGGGVVCSEVFGLHELPGQPQIMENKYIVEYEHDIFGKSNVIGFPVWFSETPAEIVSRAPQFGEHTEEVLLEGGYSWEDIASFREEEVI